MRRIFSYVAVFVFLAIITTSSSFAAVATRYATCDACGLCPTIVNGPDAAPTCAIDPKQVPGDWKSCAKCLYPVLYPVGTTPDASTSQCKTLIIDPSTNLPQNRAMTGRQFTLLGCITSGSSVGFTTQTGAPSFVQALLNVIFSLAGGLAFLYLMYGGFVFLTSQADPERLNYGRRLVYGAIAGIIITLSSVFIVNLIGSGILHIPGFGTP